MAAGLPGVITQAPFRTFRPRDLGGTYTQPSVQLHRLAKQGRVRKVAHGYYLAVPDDESVDWQPTIEDVAAGVATTIFGERVPILMHLTAARQLGAIPRALALAVVAVPRQHDPIRLLGPRAGRIIFVEREVDDLDAVLRPLPLGRALVTTPEQTVLDLARRPHLGELPGEATEALRFLVPQCDDGRLEELAGRQRMRVTLKRIREEFPADQGMS